MTELLQRDRFFVNQKTKIIELTNEYRILDDDGQQVGAIRQEGQSTVKKLARFVSSLDQFMTHKLAVYDANENKVLELERPRKLMKSRLLVSDGTGRKAGEIVQQNLIGKINFGLKDASGTDVGQIKGENWRAWNFAIVDTSEREIGRITKKWEGVLKTALTTADNYLVTIDPGVTGDLRLLTFAAAAGIDTALKQDARGLG